MKLFKFSLLLATGSILLLSSGALAGQGKDGSQAGARKWWTGPKGYVESVSLIMAREQFPNAEEMALRQRDPAGDMQGEGVYPDRIHLKQNPKSPAVSQWPPSSDSKMSPSSLRGSGGPYLPLTPSTSWNAITINDSGFIPPDSQGAVSPTQVVVAANGRIRSFNKSGVMGALNTSDTNFFVSVRNGASISDPRVRFDPLSQRWFISAITTTFPNRIVMGVSNAATITDATSFTFYFFQQDVVAPAGNVGALADYATLGIDNQAIYIGANMFSPGFQGCSAWVIRKSSVLSGGPINVVAFRNLCVNGGAGAYTPQGVDNYDPAATEGYFIGVDNLSFGTLVLRRITFPGGVPTISGNLNLVVPTTHFPLNAPHSGSGFALDNIDDRLFAAAIFKDHNTGAKTLWTAHNFRVGTTGVGGSTGTRTASRWYQIGNLAGAPSLIQSGTTFDSAATNPRFYYFPAVAVNGQGHMIMGMSTSSAVNFADAVASGRNVADALGSTQAPVLLTASATAYNVQASTPQRWGDYSLTVVDPVDLMTMWTFQEYCSAANVWAVRAVKLLAPPPATVSGLSQSSFVQGFSGNFTITGSNAGGAGYFDPGNSAFGAGGVSPNRLAVGMSGSGVTVNSITYNSPTSITVNITVAGNATVGPRTVTITNPDGQSVTTAIQVTPGSAVFGPSSFTLVGNILESGGVANVQTSDDSYLRVQNLLTKSHAIDFVGTSSVLVPSSVNVVVETSAYLNATFNGRVLIWDFVAADWVEIANGALSTSDSVFNANAPGPVGRFVNPATGEVRARVAFTGGAPTKSPWTQRVDMVRWTIAP